MNNPHKFSTEFGSDHALEPSTPIVSHHDTIKWFEAIPGEQLCIRVRGTQVNVRATARGEVVSRAAVLLRSMAKTQQAQKSGQVQNPGPHLQHPRSR